MGLAVHSVVGRDGSSGAPGALGPHSTPAVKEVSLKGLAAERAGDSFSFSKPTHYLYKNTQGWVFLSVCVMRIFVRDFLFRRQQARPPL